MPAAPAGVVSVTPGAGKAFAPPPPCIILLKLAACRSASGFVIMRLNSGDWSICRAFGLFARPGVDRIIISII